MGRVLEDTIASQIVADRGAREVSATYEAVVSLGATESALAADARRMKEEFQRRTGAFAPEDPWFEVRSRAFWDDALTRQGFAKLAAGHVALSPVHLDAFARAHRGLFVVEAATSGNGTCFADRWSGAEFPVDYLDEAQLVALDHAEECLVDARVVAVGVATYVLPGAFHHAAEATVPALRVVEAARARGMSRDDALDALLRMELVFRSSSRVKAAFAYRVESLARA